MAIAVANKPLRVLVVDDSPIITRKICMMMDLIGYQVVGTAATGREAIVAYKECLPDVVTMDITMPDVDGIEATRVLKKAFPDANIVMITSHGQEKMVLEALKAGAKGYVIKPFQQKKVFDAIQKASRRVVLQDKLDAEAAQRGGRNGEAGEATGR
jgi:two-component system chemotaxis response regulator CheY